MSTVENMIGLWSVEFGNANVGERSVSLGVKFSLDELSPAEADVWFRHRRIACELYGHEYVPGQMSLPDCRGGTPLMVVCDVPSVSANKQYRRITLKAPLDDRDAVVELGSKSGTLVLIRSDEIPEMKKQSGKKKRVTVTPLPVEELRLKRFSFLSQYGLSPLAAASIERNNFATVGECIDWIQEHGQSWGDQANPKIDETGEVVSAIARASE